MGDDRSWRYVRPKIDLSERPITVDIVPSKAIAAVGIVLGLGWIIFASIALSIDPDLAEPWIILAVAAPGLMIAAFAIATLFQKRRVTFHDLGVEVEQRGLFSARRWSALYSDFEGVLYKIRRSRGKNRATTYQIIELAHPEAGKTLPLYVATTPEVPRARWENYARLLDLPALEETGDGIAARDPDDLDKSVQELARENKLDLAYDNLEAPPKGLAVRSTRLEGGEALEVAILAPRLPLWLRVLLLVLPVLSLVFGQNDRNGPWDIVLGLALVVLGFGLWLWDRRSPRSITLTRDELRVEDAWPWDKRSEKRLPLSAIESVTLRKARSNLGKELLIQSDRGYIALGVGLSDQALVWLRRYLLAAIVTA
jgi:hypothetical protein